MERSVLIAGFGGQGVMLIGKTLGRAAAEMGMDVTFFPAYGAQQRGGTANCTLITSEEEILCPLRDMFDHLIIMNQLSLPAFGKKLKKGGTMLVNSSLTAISKEEYPDCLEIPFGEIAAGLGNVKASNMAAMGAYAALHEAFELEALKKLTAQMFENRPELAELNLRAIDAGFRAAREQMSLREKERRREA